VLDVIPIMKNGRKHLIISRSSLFYSLVNAMNDAMTMVKSRTEKKFLKNAF